MAECVSIYYKATSIEWQVPFFDLNLVLGFGTDASAQVMVADYENLDCEEPVMLRKEHIHTVPSQMGGEIELWNVEKALHRTWLKVEKEWPGREIRMEVDGNEFGRGVVIDDGVRKNQNWAFNVKYSAEALTYTWWITGPTSIVTFDFWFAPRGELMEAWQG